MQVPSKRFLSFGRFTVHGSRFQDCQWLPEALALSFTLQVLWLYLSPWPWSVLFPCWYLLLHHNVNLLLIVHIFSYLFKTPLRTNLKTETFDWFPFHFYTFAFWFLKYFQKSWRFSLFLFFFFLLTLEFRLQLGINLPGVSFYILLSLWVCISSLVSSDRVYVFFSISKTFSVICLSYLIGIFIIFLKQTLFLNNLLLLNL